MNRRIGTTILSVVALAASGQAVAQTEVPNTFQAGQPARAADVNANFDAVEGAIDANGSSISVNEAAIEANSTDIGANTSSIASNTTAIAVNAGEISSNVTAIENNASSIASLTVGSGVHVYSQGVSIGRFLGTDLTDGTNAVIMGTAIWLVSESGFVFTVDASGNSPRYLTPVNVLYYLEAGCAGDAYMDGLRLGWTASSGAVFRTPLDGGAAIYYTERGQQSVDRQAASEYVEGGVGCRGSSSNNANFRALPNDPAITGVPNTAPVRPYLVGVP